MNVKDLCLLKFKNLKGSELSYFRAKTELSNKGNLKPIRVYLLTESELILRRYMNKQASKKEELIFPFISNTTDPKTLAKQIRNFTRRVNDRLKEATMELELPFVITTYHARHSFATHLKEKGVGIESINERMGHNSLKTTEIYLKSFTSETMRKENELLLKFD